MKEYVPYLFVSQTIRSVVAPNRPGVYVLGENENGFSPTYVGRSDVCLRSRLLHHNYLYTFSYFIFKYAETPYEAFQLESKWWHDYLTHGAALFNQNHPGSPARMNKDCPYCKFATDIHQYMLAG